MARPGWSARFSGRDLEDVAFSNPGDGAKDADEDVRTSWRSWGLVVEVYWPGRRSIGVGAFEAESTTPTAYG